eukprot:6022226-Amphidinium_carterae.1
MRSEMGVEQNANPSLGNYHSYYARTKIRPLKIEGAEGVSDLSQNPNLAQFGHHFEELAQLDHRYLKQCCQSWCRPKFGQQHTAEGAEKGAMMLWQ